MEGKIDICWIFSENEITQKMLVVNLKLQQLLQKKIAEI